MQITEKLYWYPWQGRANNCNSYLYKGEQTILFDPGHIRNELNENCYEMLVSQLSKDGVNLKDIDLILCTHGHPDHVESAGLVREDSGARFAIHADDQFILEAIAQQYSARSGKELPSLEADLNLKEGKLDLGKDSSDQIEVLHTPGHSPGCVCFYLPEEKALISGDTIFEGSIGRTDFPGGDMAAMGRSVDKLMQVTDIEYLLPGHMNCVTGVEAVRSNLKRIKGVFFS